MLRLFRGERFTVILTHKLSEKEEARFKAWWYAVRKKDDFKMERLPLFFKEGNISKDEFRPLKLKVTEITELQYMRDLTKLTEVNGE